jgi:hypothetical protein
MPYSAESPAVIFRFEKFVTGKTDDAVRRILRVFAQNNVPVDIGIDVSSIDRSSNQMDMFRPYISAGIIGLSANYPDFVKPGSAASAAAAEKTRVELKKNIETLRAYYGAVPVAFTTDTVITEQSYNIIRDAGFKIVSTFASVEPLSSRKLVDYLGKEDDRGMFRLPVIADAAYWNRDKRKIGTYYSKDAMADLLRAIGDASANIGISVLLMEPESFLTADNRIDEKRITDLDQLIKQINKIGKITTFESWNNFAAQWLTAKPRIRAAKPPPAKGGWMVIFRLDDVTRGWYEDVVEEIIKVFRKNGAPLDLGIIAYGNGPESFQMPMVRKYFDEGAVDISMHGYSWSMADFATFDTAKSGASYPELKFYMDMARQQYLAYYGFAPTSFTVPTDVFNCDGYRAVQNAGFKVFSVHMTQEPHPSLRPVDCNGSPTESGMYRIPTASDVCMWDEGKREWADLYTFDNLLNGVPYKYWYDEENFYHDLDAMAQQQLKLFGVTSIGIHPDAFVDSAKKIDRAKIEKLNTTIGWVKQFATITTFNSWYEWALTQRR